MWSVFRKATKAQASLQVRVAQLEIEREAYRQEVFETNRYAAWVSHERQSLIDRLNFGTYATQYDEARLRIVELEAYIENLETRLTESEDQRHALATRIETPRLSARVAPVAVSQPAEPSAPVGKSNVAAKVSGSVETSIARNSKATGRTSANAKAAPPLVKASAPVKAAKAGAVSGAAVAVAGASQKSAATAPKPSAAKAKAVVVAGPAKLKGNRTTEKVSAAPTAKPQAVVRTEKQQAVNAGPKDKSAIRPGAPTSPSKKKAIS